MSELRLSYNSNPPTLANLLSREEQQVLALKLAQVMNSGHGEVKVKIRNNRIMFIDVTMGVKLKGSS